MNKYKALCMLTVFLGLNACGKLYTNYDEINDYLTAESNHTFSSKTPLPAKYDIPMECKGSNRFQTCNNYKGVFLLKEVLNEYNINPVNLKDSEDKKLGFDEGQKYILISVPYTLLHIMSFGIIPLYIVETVNAEYKDGDYEIEKEIELKYWNSTLFFSNYDIDKEELKKGALKKTLNQAIKDGKIK